MDKGQNNRYEALIYTGNNNDKNSSQIMQPQY